MLRFSWQGRAPAEAAEPSKKLQQLQDEVARLHQAGSYEQALPLAKQVLALTVAEFGPDSLQASIQSSGVGIVAEGRAILPRPRANMPNTCASWRSCLAGTATIVADALEHLGHALVKLGRLTEAEARYSREIQI